MTTDQLFKKNSQLSRRLCLEPLIKYEPTLALNCLRYLFSTEIRRWIPTPKQFVTNTYISLIISEKYRFSPTYRLI